MAKQSNNPAPHAGEKEAPAIPKSGQTPGMGAPPHQAGDREPGTAPDGEALPPRTIDPKPDGPDEDVSELDDPMAGSPDREPGKDHPGQRPVTDNKAGG